MTTETKRTDEQVWADILKLLLDGTMMHVSLFEFFTIKGIIGYAALHKHHAEEEFDTYLHVAGDYMNEYKKMAEMSNISQPVIELDGATTKEIMVKGMEAYENWEKKVCEEMKNYRNELTANAEHLDHLINNVHQELKCIHLMENDLLDDKCQELDEWLQKKFGDD